MREGDKGWSSVVRGRGREGICYKGFVDSDLGSVCGELSPLVDIMEIVFRAM